MQALACRACARAAAGYTATSVSRPAVLAVGVKRVASDAGRAGGAGAERAGTLLVAALRVALLSARSLSN